MLSRVVLSSVVAALLLCSCAEECEVGAPASCEGNVARWCSSGKPGPDALGGGTPTWGQVDCGERRCQLSRSGLEAFCVLPEEPAAACAGDVRQACDSETSYVHCLEGFATGRLSCRSCTPRTPPSDVLCEGGFGSKCTLDADCASDLRCKESFCSH